MNLGTWVGWRLQVKSKVQGKTWVLAMAILTAAAPMAQAQTLGTNSYSFDKVSAPAVTNRSLISGAERNKPSKQLTGTWNLRLSGTRNQDEFSQQTYSDMSLGVSIVYLPNPIVKFDVRPELYYRTGYQQSETPNDAQSSSWTVRHAGVDLTPISYASFQIGALNQQQLHSRLLMDNRAFPALRASLQSSSKYTLQSGLRAQSSVASSNTSLGTGTNPREKTPTFNSGGAFLNFDFTNFQWRNSASYFEFQDLPSSVAASSRFSGNTTTDLNGTDYRFSHEFKGLEFQTALSWQAASFLKIKLNGAFVKNNSAPTSRNQAYWINPSMDLAFSDKFALTPTADFFRVEPDAVVSSYNSSFLQSNRFGYRAGLGMLLGQNFMLSVRVGQRDAIFSNSPQSKENTVELIMETLDVKI